VILDYFSPRLFRYRPGAVIRPATLRHAHDYLITKLKRLQAAVDKLGLMAGDQVK
jgi:hypothetical protein